MEEVRQLTESETRLLQLLGNVRGFTDNQIEFLSTEFKTRELPLVELSLKNDLLRDSFILLCSFCLWQIQIPWLMNVVVFIAWLNSTAYIGSSLWQAFTKVDFRYVRIYVSFGRHIVQKVERAVVHGIFVAALIYAGYLISAIVFILAMMASILTEIWEKKALALVLEKNR